MVTDRLIIRKFSIIDFDEFKKFVLDKMSGKYAIYDDQLPTSDEGIYGLLKFLAQSKYYYAVVLKSDLKLIGLLSLIDMENGSYNFGYSIHYSYQGVGYGFEACKALISIARINEIDILDAITREENIPSIRLLEKLGFEFIDKRMKITNKEASYSSLHYIKALKKD